MFFSMISLLCERVVIRFLIVSGNIVFLSFIVRASFDLWMKFCMKLQSWSIAQTGYEEAGEVSDICKYIIFNKLLDYLFMMAIVSIICLFDSNYIVLKKKSTRLDYKDLIKKIRIIKIIVILINNNEKDENHIFQEKIYRNSHYAFHLSNPPNNNSKNQRIINMCTLQKRGNIFLLTLTGDDQHRLNPTLISTLRSHLSQAKAQSTRGSALVTLAEGKFFSNGFDLEWAQKNSSSTDGAHAKLLEMVELFRPVVKDLIALPMPTIAAVTGHAAAAGMVLALSHDHVFMRGDRGVMYMSEVDIGLPLPDYFTVLFRSKVASPAARRNVLLNGMKLKAEDAVAMGIIDSAYDNAEKTVEAAVQLAEKLGKRKWDGEVYGEIRKSLHPELCDIVGLVGTGVATSRL